MPRRSSGEGTIKQRSNGLWYAALRVDGERKWFYSKSKREVERKLHEAQVDRHLGLLLMTPSQRVGAFLDSWLTMYVAPSVEATTLSNYGKNVRRAAPFIGRYRLDKLRGEHLQRCYNDLLAEGLSPRSVAQLHRVLRRAFNQAISMGLIARNPWKEATPPRAERRPMTILSSPQVQRLISESTDHRLHALFVLLVTTGMRVGEATALRWSDIDLPGGRAVISRTIRRESGKGMQLAEPKTEPVAERCSWHPVR